MSIAVPMQSQSPPNPGEPMTEAEMTDHAAPNPSEPMTEADLPNAEMSTSGEPMPDQPSESARELMTDNEESMADTQRMLNPHETALAVLNDLACELGADEVRVLASIANRLKGGQAAYGPLLLASDTRQFRAKEAREELEDALVYLACAWLQDQEVT